MISPAEIGAAGDSVMVSVTAVRSSLLHSVILFTSSAKYVLLPTTLSVGFTTIFPPVKASYQTKVYPGATAIALFASRV